jgi:membrane protease YdiL (CAAX protease family)
MNYSSWDITVADSVPTNESAHLFNGRAKRPNISLLVETIVVTIAAILAVRLLATSDISTIGWLVGPVILVTAAFAPRIIKGGQFPKVGFNSKQIGFILVTLFWTCLAIFPVVFIGLWLLRFWGFGLPLQPVLPQGHKWACWVFYQFMYVAVAEEVFFRGYVQSNILMLAGTVEHRWCRLWNWLSIVLSAACFAVAHIIVQGQIISVLTFLPGVVLGWLFIRTKSLLAPILFHGLANTCYCVMAAALV